MFLIFCRVIGGAWREYADFTSQLLYLAFASEKDVHPLWP